MANKDFKIKNGLQAGQGIKSNVDHDMRQTFGTWAQYGFTNYGETAGVIAQSKSDTPLVVVRERDNANATVFDAYIHRPVNNAFSGLGVDNNILGINNTYFLEDDQENLRRVTAVFNKLVIDAVDSDNGDIFFPGYHGKYEIVTYYKDSADSNENTYVAASFDKHGQSFTNKIELIGDYLNGNRDGGTGRYRLDYIGQNEGIPQVQISMLEGADGDSADVQQNMLGHLYDSDAGYYNHSYKNLTINDGFNISEFNPYTAFGGAAMPITGIGVGQEAGWSQASIRSRGEHDWGLSGFGINPEKPRAIVNLQAGDVSGSDNSYLSSSTRYGQLLFSPWSGYRGTSEWITPAGVIEAYATEDHDSDRFGTALRFYSTRDGQFAGSTDFTHDDRYIQFQGTDIEGSHALKVTSEIGFTGDITAGGDSSINVTDDLKVIGSDPNKNTVIGDAIFGGISNYRTHGFQVNADETSWAMIQLNEYEGGIDKPVNAFPNAGMAIALYGGEPSSYAPVTNNKRIFAITGTAANDSSGTVPSTANVRIFGLTTQDQTDSNRGAKLVFAATPDNDQSVRAMMELDGRTMLLGNNDVDGGRARIRSVGHGIFIEDHLEVQDSAEFQDTVRFTGDSNQITGNLKIEGNLVVGVDETQDRMTVRATLKNEGLMAFATYDQATVDYYAGLANGGFINIDSGATVHVPDGNNGNPVNKTWTGSSFDILTDAQPDFDALTADSATIPKLSGDITFDGNLEGPATWYIDPAPIDSEGGLVVIRGSLQVNGTQTIVNSQTVTINDKSLILGDSATTPSLADGASVQFGDYDSAATLSYDAALDRLHFDKGIEVGTSASGQTKLATINQEGGNEIGLKVKARTNRATLQVADNDTTAYVVAEDGKAIYGQNGNLASADMVIDGSGNVGIGTTSPDRTLHVTRGDGTGTVIKVGNTGTSNAVIEFSDTSTTDTVSIGSVGNDLTLKSDDGDISFNTTGDPATASMYVERGGNVGIGTTSPQQLLHVNGGAGDTTIQITNTVSGSGATDGFSLTVENPSGDVNIRNREATNMRFYTSNIERLRITSSGDLQVSSGHVLPDTSTQDLGDSDNPWQNIYTQDLMLSNEKREEGNSVDGTKGNWTIQEGENDLYIINNKNGKKFRFALEEIE